MTSSSRASISGNLTGGNTARELLENCANNLAEASRLLLNEEMSGGRSASVPCLPIPITPRPNTAGTHSPGNSNSARIEHQKLFNYQPAKTSTKPDPKKGGVNRNRRAKKARVDSGGQCSSGVWLHKFVCLETTDHDTTPSVKQKIDLQMKGLGEKELVIDKKAKGQEIMNKFYEAFPPLESSGGVELLRTSTRSGRGLDVIPIPKGGFTVDYLRSVLGQARCYLRPIQKDLQDSCAPECDGIDELVSELFIRVY